MAADDDDESNALRNAWNGKYKIRNMRPFDKYTKPTSEKYAFLELRQAFGRMTNLRYSVIKNYKILGKLLMYPNEQLYYERNNEMALAMCRMCGPIKKDMSDHVRKIAGIYRCLRRRSARDISQNNHD